jgi:CheY-like chemotaxis protein
MNLAGNAIKFTEKGKVELTVTAVGNSGNTHHLKFSIKDSGIGIPADKLGTIFESFGQASADTTRKFGGTGLGLTISRQLVEMHQSELKVESELGVGSNFFFTIAYQEGKLVEETTLDTQANVTEIRGRRILLVEDNEFNQMVAVDTLADLFTDLTVDVAEDGFIALKKLSEQHYDMVLMDIQLPEMDGFETTRKIRTTLPKPINQIKICAMTASVTKERIDECISSGMNDYLMKPFVPADLKEKVIKNILSIT